MPESSAPSWHASLLGAARVEGPLGPVERLRTRAAFLLLVYLLLNRARTHARDELADRFWPDDEPESARGKLRLALHSIGTALGPLLKADRHAVWVGRPACVDSDCDELFRLVASASSEGREARLVRAVELYRGPFLPGFYDDWALEERDRIEATVANALRELADGHAAADRWPLALEAASRLVALEPYDEAAHVLVLRSLRALGRHEALARTLDWTRERFAELGTRPGEEIEAFARVEMPNEADEGTALLGREADLARTLRAVEAAGAVTLWGPPGVGKTRLAREVVRALGGQAVFVSVVGLASVEALAGVLRPALGGGATGSLADVAEAASPRLLVVDNLESLPDEALATFAELRRCNAGLRFLFTSQRRSGLEEVVVLLAPLDVPPEGASVAQVAAATSVRLLRERARERGMRLRVDEGNAAALGALCRRLEGMPLALELAAEWLDVVGPADILKRLDESGRRLDARLPGRDPRHRSLETAIAASLIRLDDRLRAAHRALAVFVGGWDLDAAEAVLGGDAVELLASLESRALVKADSTGDRVRYAMLESIRLLVVATTPEAERSEALRRHAEHFRRVGQAMQSDPTSLVERYRADDENVRQAAETILAVDPDADSAGQGIIGFQGYWQKLGRWGLAESCLRAALDRLPPGPSAMRARLNAFLGYIGYCVDDLALAEGCARATYDAYVALGDHDRAARAGGALGHALVGRGDLAGAIPLLREHLAIARAQNRGFHGGDLLYACLILGETLLSAGEEAEGLALVEESRRLGAEAGADARMGCACAVLGWHLRLTGRVPEGAAALRRAVELLDGSAEPFRSVTAGARLATALADGGELASARAELAAAADLAQALGRDEGYADVAEAAAWITWSAEEPATTVRLLAAARLWRRRTRALAPAHLASVERLDRLAEAALSSELVAQERLQGETTSRAEILAVVRRVSQF